MEHLTVRTAKLEFQADIIVFEHLDAGSQAGRFTAAT